MEATLRCSHTVIDIEKLLSVLLSGPETISHTKPNPTTPIKLIKKIRKQLQKEDRSLDADEELISANTEQIAHLELNDQLRSKHNMASMVDCSRQN